MIAMHVVGSRIHYFFERRIVNLKLEVQGNDTLQDCPFVLRYAGPTVFLQRIS